MSAWLLKKLVFGLRRSAESRPAKERRTEDGTPFHLGGQLGELVEEAIFDA